MFKAAVLKAAGEPLQIVETDDWSFQLKYWRVHHEWGAVVRLKAAALNRRDLWIRLGQYAGIEYPMILGSDGAGIVESVSGEDQSWVGREVIINPAYGWGAIEAFQDPTTFQILGLPAGGTFAQLVRVPTESLFEKPPHLSWHEAAALPLAGLTAFRALTSRAHLVAGESVLVTGAGGGAATFAILFAKALGAVVYVTTGNDVKLARAIELGAAGGVNYHETDWDTKLKDVETYVELRQMNFDVIIDSAMGDGLSRFIKLAKPGARIVFYGATNGNPSEINSRSVFWKQLSLLGTTMGSPADFAAMLAFVNEHKLRPVIDEVFPLENVNEALDRMQSSSQFGKIVLHIAD
jgi:NADPH:quinone reductase-like Zn-dependent oxidoreductase